MKESIKISYQARILLITHTFFLTGICFSNIFFNVFLWKLSSSIKTAALFNLFHYAAVPFVFYIGTKIIKKLSTLKCIQLGLYVHACFFILVLWLQHNAAEFVAVLGILMGFGQGLYYLGYNVLTYDYTNNITRYKFSGYNGAANAFAGIIAPLVGGLIIHTYGKLNGYIIVFAVSLCCFLLSVLIINIIKSSHDNYSISFSAAKKLINNDWKRVSWAMLFRGIREGVISFLLFLLFYKITRSELQLGFFNLVLSCITMISFYLVGILIKRDRRISSIYWGSVLLVIATTIIVWQENELSLWIFGIANSLFYPMISVPLTSVSYNVIRKNPTTAKRRIEFLTLREIPLNIGRVMGIGMLLVFLNNELPIAWLVWGLGVCQLPIGVLLKTVKETDSVSRVN